MKKNKGFTLLVAIVVTASLLLVSFMVVNLAFKQLLISDANEESQYAFYNADSGVDCAVYWDLLDPALSRFATTTTGTIACNGQTGITTGSQTTIPTTPSTSLIGGGGNGNPTSIFYLTFTKGCVIVRVTKSYSGNTLITTIDSRGYNTCSVTAPRRFERGVTLTY
jgi:hypothetical protein